MTLIVATVVVIALLVAALAIFLFMIGGLLKRTADTLDNCSQSVKNIAYQAKELGPSIERINETGGTVVGALPLLCDAAESIGVAKSAPYVDPSEDPYPAPSPAPAAAAPPAPRPATLAVAPATSSAAPGPAPAAVATAARPSSVGYLDGDEPRGTLGYLDA